MTNESGARGCAHGQCDCGRESAAPRGISIDRRTMLSQATLFAAAAALAACGTSGFDIPTAPGNLSSTLKLSDYPALANVGGMATLTVSGSPLVVVRTGTGSFVALSRICPHQGSIIGVYSDGFQCPRHGATFDTSGNWIGGQPTNNMQSYATTYTVATDTLQIG